MQHTIAFAISVLQSANSRILFQQKILLPGTTRATQPWFVKPAILMTIPKGMHKFALDNTGN